MSEERGDHELMRGIAARDVAAFKALFDRYAPLSLAVARRVLGRASEAEDVVNEVFFEVWDKADRFVADRGSPRTYLLLVTRSRAIDRRRERSSGVKGKTLGTPAGLDLTASGEPGPASSAASAEDAHVVRRLLASLPEDERAAVQRSFFDGMTHREIAEATGTPLGTVKGRIRRALIRMRDELRKREGGAD